MGIRPDLPLTDLKEDEYGFATIAEHVAATIGQSPAATGMGIGIEGAWGSGKTTFANQIVTYLERQKPPPMIVKYNAWAAVDEAEAAMGLLRELYSRCIIESAAVGTLVSLDVFPEILKDPMERDAAAELRAIFEAHRPPREAAANALARPVRWTGVESGTLNGNSEHFSRMSDAMRGCLPENFFDALLDTGTELPQSLAFWRTERLQRIARDDARAKERARLKGAARSFKVRP